MMETGSAPSIDCLNVGGTCATIVHVDLDFGDYGSANHRDLDAARRELKSAVSQAHSRTIEINLRADRVGAAIVGILAEAEATARKQGGRLKLHNTVPIVREVLSICGYEKLLD